MSIRSAAQSVLLLAAAAIGLATTPAVGATTHEHYQQTVAPLPCNPQSFTCGVGFPAIGANQQLNVNRVSCWINTIGSSATLKRVTLYLYDAGNQSQLQDFLPVNAPSTANANERDFVVSQAVDVQVAAGGHIAVAFDFLSGMPNEASCTATGTLFTQT